MCMGTGWGISLFQSMMVIKDKRFYNWGRKKFDRPIKGGEKGEAKQQL